MVNMLGSRASDILHPSVKEIIYEPLLKENLKKWLEEKNSGCEVKLTKSPDVIVYDKKCPTCGQIIESEATRIEIERSPYTYNHGNNYCDIIYAVSTRGMSNLNGIPIKKVPKRVIEKSTVTVLHFTECCDINEVKSMVAKFETLILRKKTKEFPISISLGIVTKHQALRYLNGEKQWWEDPLLKVK